VVLSYCTVVADSSDLGNIFSMEREKKGGLRKSGSGEQSIDENICGCANPNARKQKDW
jgi:hypothetical protein